MSTRIQVGVQRKIGLPNFGSDGANCSIDAECDSSLLSQPSELTKRIAELYAQCEAAVQSQLAQATLLTSSDHTKKQDAATNSASTRDFATNAISSETPAVRSNGHTHRPISQAQRKVILDMSRQRGISLAELLATQNGIDNLDELSISQASQIISRLRTLRPRESEAKVS